jgi:hypothetical protein
MAYGTRDKSMASSYHQELYVPLEKTDKRKGNIMLLTARPK